jgi:diguanylate cyclase (GGDEF)-like protein
VRLITRNDTTLAMALVAATVILFRRPLRSLFDAAHEFESRYQIDLLPALILLVVVFVFHQYQKHSSAKADARAAAAEATQARSRSEELEELMTFGQALANALDLTSLQQALWKFLPRFTHGRAFWVLARNGERWEILLNDASDERTLDRLEPIAARAIARDTLEPEDDDTPGGDFCVPLVAGGAPVGVMGVVTPTPLSSGERQALGAAAAVMAVSVRNMQVLYQTRDLSLRDALTGCFNRVYGVERLDGELRRARRSGRPVSALLCDFDHFASVNDQLGHLKGDELLRNAALTLNRVVRTTDIRCRYAGDEFLVILPDTNAAGAVQVAESVRKELAMTANAGDVSVGVTVSIGVATSGSEDRSAMSVLERADAALYVAKHNGRNRFSIAPTQGPPLAFRRS